MMRARLQPVRRRAHVFIHRRGRWIGSVGVASPSYVEAAPSSVLRDNPVLEVVDRIVERLFYTWSSAHVTHTHTFNSVLLPCWG